MDRKRYKELDMLRGIAIIGVLIIHITSPMVRNGDTIGLLFNQISRFSVPAFLVLSGLGLTLSDSLADGYVNFLRKQLTKIILAYVSWSIVYFVFSGPPYSIVSFFKGLFFGSNYYHLYYVPVIIALYVTYPIIVRFSKNSVGLLVVLFVTILSQMADGFTGLNIFNNPLNIFNWLFYFAFGIWMAIDFDKKMSEIKKRRKIILLLLFLSLIIIGLEIFYTGATTTMRPSVILYSVMCILWVFSLSWNNIKNQQLIELSKASYGIYLSHVFVLTVYEKIYVYLELNLNSVVYLMTTLVIVSLLSFALAKSVNLKYMLKR